MDILDPLQRQQILQQQMRQEQVNQPIPTEPQVDQQKLAGWNNFFDKLSGDTALQQTLFTFAAKMLNGTRPGESPGGAIAGGVAEGMQQYAGMKTAAEDRALKKKYLETQNRAAEVGIAGNQQEQSQRAQAFPAEQRMKNAQATTAEVTAANAPAAGRLALEGEEAGIGVKKAQTKQLSAYADYLTRKDGSGAGGAGTGGQGGAQQQFAQTVAQSLFKEHPDVFKTQDAAYLYSVDLLQNMQNQKPWEQVKVETYAKANYGYMSPKERGEFDTMMGKMEADYKSGAMTLSNPKPQGGQGAAPTGVPPQSAVVPPAGADWESRLTPGQKAELDRALQQNQVMVERFGLDRVKRKLAEKAGWISP